MLILPDYHFPDFFFQKILYEKEIIMSQRGGGGGIFYFEYSNSNPVAYLYEYGLTSSSQDSLTISACMGVEIAKFYTCPGTS